MAKRRAARVLRSRSPRARVRARPATAQEAASPDWLTDPDPKRRIRAARAALAKRPKSAAKAALHSAIAHARMDLGDLAGARQEWLSMARSGLTPVRALLEAGVLAEAAGHPRVAEKDYKAAARRSRGPAERAEAWAVLARFYVRTGDAKRALAFLRQHMRGPSTPLLTAAAAYIEARITRDPTPLLRYKKLLLARQKEIPLFGYFLGFLDLWDGRTLDSVKTFRSFVSRGIDAAADWGRELAPEIDHARRTILQIEASARVPMP